MKKKLLIGVFVVLLIIIFVIMIPRKKSLNKEFFTEIRFDNTGKSSLPPSIKGNEDVIFSFSRTVGIDDPLVPVGDENGYTMEQGTTYITSSDGKIRCTGYYVTVEGIPKAAWIEAVKLENNYSCTEAITLFPANVTKELIIESLKD